MPHQMVHATRHQAIQYKRHSMTRQKSEDLSVRPLPSLSISSMSTMGLPVPVDLRHCTILPGIAPTYVLRCPAHMVLSFVRPLHAFPSSRGGGGGRGLGRYLAPKKTRVMSPWGSGGPWSAMCMQRRCAKAMTLASLATNISSLRGNLDGWKCYTCHIPCHLHWIRSSDMTG